MRPAGHSTYEPAPLPPVGLRWTAELHEALSTADHDLGSLHGQIMARPESAALIALACRREAVASCRLDGSPVRLADLLWYELDGKRADGLACSVGDARICHNYADLLQASAWLSPRPHDSAGQHDTSAATPGPAGAAEHPLLRRSLSSLHAQLYRGVRGRDERAGALRSTEIWLGPRGSTARTALYVPPAPEHIPEHLARLLTFSVEPVAMPPLAKLALILYQLEAIHPFVDGSGRVARLAMIRLLARTHGTSAHLLCPSQQLVAELGDHFGAARRVRETGDWEAWIMHIARLLSRAARDQTRTLEQSTQLLRQHTQQVDRQEASVRETATTLLAHLASHPLISVQAAAEVCQRTYANANLLIRRLESMGLLREITGRERHRRYVYMPYLALLQPDKP